jgi:hypothetical protein
MVDRHFNVLGDRSGVLRQWFNADKIYATLPFLQENFIPFYYDKDTCYYYQLSDEVQLDLFFRKVLDPINRATDALADFLIYTNSNIEFLFTNIDAHNQFFTHIIHWGMTDKLNYELIGDDYLVHAHGHTMAFTLNRKDLDIHLVKPKY